MNQEEQEINYTELNELLENAVKKLMENKESDYYILCTNKFYEKLKKEMPERIKIINNKKYVYINNRYIELVFTDKAVEFPNTKKVKVEKKNFAQDYLMRGKRWNNKK